MCNPTLSSSDNDDHVRRGKGGRREREEREGGERETVERDDGGKGMDRDKEREGDISREGSGVTTGT